MPAEPARHAARNALLRAVASVARPLRLSKPESRVDAPRRVLFIRPDHLGDFLFATPALERWRQRAPANVETILSVGPWSADLAARGPAVGRIEVFPYPGFTRRPKGGAWKPYTALARLARRLRSEHIDMAVILRFDHWWGGLLAYSAGIPLRLGYATEPLRHFLNATLPYVGVAHEVERNLALVGRALELCGGRPTVEPMDVFPRLVYEIQPEERHAAVQILARLGVTPECPLIALHPGAGAPVKQWPPERFGALADALAETYGARILLTGAPAELPLCWRVAARARAKVHVLAGQTNVPALAALLAFCDLVIGADSGPLHLAVAVGAPTIHVYGPADPALFGPWSDRPAQHRVLMADCPCAPCNRLDYAPPELAAHRCVEAVSVEQVLAVASEMLGAWHFGRREVQ